MHFYRIALKHVGGKERLRDDGPVFAGMCNSPNPRESDATSKMLALTVFFSLLASEFYTLRGDKESLKVQILQKF